MNNRYSILMLAVIAITPSFTWPKAEKIDTQSVEELLNKKLPEKKDTKKRNKKKKLSLNFDATELIDIINMIAAERNINVILPIGAQAITNKVTLRMENPVTLDEAWHLLHTLLEVAGYTMLQRDKTYTVVKTSPTINREPAPIFVGTEPEQLPDYEKRITYIAYLSHIKVPRPEGENQPGELQGILKEILSPTALVKYEAFANALILNDNANTIKSAMTIIKELDKPGFEESFEIVRLKYAKADIIADLFNKSILAVDPKARLTARKPSEAMYFPQGTRIIPEPNENSLFVFGPAQAIERVKEFILKYLDVELGTGKSILHTYQLQYLEADSFEQVLRNIVTSASTGGTGQSKAGAGGTGPERFFEDVIITTDKPTNRGAATQGGTEYFGSNKLIIAARTEDWERIKKIIEELDTPQPQVIIEVLIADLAINDDRVLGSMMRNPKAIPLPKLGDSLGSMEFQSEQLIPGQVATNIPVPPNTLPAGSSSIDADLAKFNGQVGNNIASVNILAGLTPGSTAITIADDDGSVWNILQVLQNYGQAKILSHPHVIATNNKKATVAIGESRLVVGQAVGSSGGATTAKNEYVDAKLKVEIVPRISGAKTVNMSLNIDIEDFTTTNLSNANRNTRKIVTNANIVSGDILALGGLIKENTGIQMSETPILGQIPILGWLFKRREGVSIKNNLTVFIRPTVIEPRLRGGIGEYTKDYIQLAKDYVQDGLLFDTMRDPVTRWFFKTTNDTDQAVNLFLEQNKEPEKTFDTPHLQLEPGVGSSDIELHKNPTESTRSCDTCVAADNTKRAEQLKTLSEGLENPLVATKQGGCQSVLNT